MYEAMTFEAILQRMLDSVGSKVDKREGSIIYDALAPFAIEMTLLYQELDLILNETFADTATREYLIRRSAERGLEPQEATKAIVQGEFTPTTIDLMGKRFNCDSVNFVVVEMEEPGRYRLECESAGEAGNLESGTLLPIDFVNGLQTAQITGLLIPGEEEEDTEALRKRFFESVSQQAFGGNQAYYRQSVNELDGVGGTKIFPVWNGGGTVKLVILDAQHNPPSQALIDAVQVSIDPVGHSGEGLGLAPIGHVVTVEGAESVTIDIETVLTYQSGYDYNAVKDAIDGMLDEYYGELKLEWEINNATVVRISQLETRLLNTDGILDIRDTTINGAAANLQLGPSQIPEKGAFSDGA